MPEQQIDKKSRSTAPQPAKKPSTPPVSTPAQEKNDAFKFEMTYANGGFNNGVEVKPARDGKLELKIAIYGGGEQKVMKIHPLPPSIEKLIKAYEIGSESEESDTPEITEELQRYFDEIRTILSAKIVDILSEADGKIADAIRSTVEQVNQ